MVVNTRASKRKRDAEETVESDSQLETPHNGDNIKTPRSEATKEQDMQAAWDRVKMGVAQLVALVGNEAVDLRDGTMKHIRIVYDDAVEAQGFGPPAAKRSQKGTPRKLDFASDPASVSTPIATPPSRSYMDLIAGAKRTVGRGSLVASADSPTPRGRDTIKTPIPNRRLMSRRPSLLAHSSTPK